MSSGQMTVLVAAVAAVVLVLVVLLAVLVQARRAGRRTEAALATSRAEMAALQARLDELTAPPAAPASAPPAPRRRVGEPEFVITTAGRSRADEDVSAPPPVDARQFASVALGESVVRLVSLGYGVRRALSAENRNRIAFEMRREVRRSRRDRRRELRDLRRKLREEPVQPDRAEDAEESAA